MKSEDKEKIKDAILQAAASNTHTPLVDLAKQACEAIDHIHRYDDAKTSGETNKNPI